MTDLSSDDPRHGTENGYRHFACRCPACREAHRQHCKKFRKRVEGTLEPDDSRHGLNGYRNYHCRCSVCTDANKKAFAEYDKTYIRKRKTLESDDPRHGTWNAYCNYSCRCSKCIGAAQEYRKPRNNE